MRFAIVDDEKLYYDSFLPLCEQYMAKKNEDFVIDYYTNGVSFLENVKTNYDVVFMDVQMPVMDGMRTAEKFRMVNNTAILIFLTNFERFAVRGYNVDAMDYLIKPIDYAQLSSVLDKTLDKVRKLTTEQFVINTADGLIRVPLSDIVYLESIKHHIIFHTLHGDYDCWGSLKKYEAQLPDEKFYRCNSCYIVNLQFVSEVKSNTVIVNKTELVVSKVRKRGLIDAITKYTF